MTNAVTRAARTALSARLALSLACVTAVVLCAPSFAQAQAAAPAAKAPVKAVPKPAPAAPAPAAPAANAPATPAPADADAAFATAKAAFEALPEADRRAVQEALIWTGDFQGTATGEFGKRTRDALVAFETRNHNNPDGTVDAGEVAKVLATAQEIKKAAGFAMVTDAASGAQIGVPQKLLPTKGTSAEGQTFSSANGDHQLLLFAQRGADADLAKQYEAASASTPERKVTYKLSKPEYFVVSGEAGPTKFYTRVARASAGGEAVLRGFTLSYPLSAAKTFNNAALAIANSFNPSPGAAAIAVAASTPVAAGVPQPPAKPAPAKPVPAPGSGIVATATVIAAGKAVAILPPGCTTPTAGGVSLRVAGTDAASGMSLLEFAAPKALPVSLAAVAIADGAALVVTGFGGNGTPLAPASLNATPGDAVVSGDAKDQPRIMAPVQPPAAGSAVFDRAGHFVGLIGPMAKEPRRFAGVVPLMTHPLIALPRVLAFAAIAGTLPPAGQEGTDKPRSLGEIVSASRASLLGIECGK